MIVGMGTDIVETDRIRDLVERRGARFLERWFTESEIGYCRGKGKPYVHLAARLAAKEAVFKSLKLPRSAPICWKDIAIEIGPDGSPGIVLDGMPRAEAARLGVTALHLSISHCAAYAVAMAMAERER